MHFFFLNLLIACNYLNNQKKTYPKVPGRLYPIKLNYRPVLVEDKYSKSERFNPSPYIQIMQIIDKSYPGSYKDV